MRKLIKMNLHQYKNLDQGGCETPEIDALHYIFQSSPEGQIGFFAGPIRPPQALCLTTPI